MIDITAPPTRVKYKGCTPVRERPIMFAGAMVRAILAGAKSQTRRVVKMHADGSSYDRCRYGVPGERLWVRETWCQAMDVDSCREMEGVAYYAADGKEVAKLGDDGGREWRRDGVAASPWRSPRHMPRWASRLALEVTGVRVERLQDISEADAQDEGVQPDMSPCEHPFHTCAEVSCIGPGHRAAFGELWDSINGKRAPWASNPWVWVIAFRRLP